MSAPSAEAHRPRWRTALSLVLALLLIGGGYWLATRQPDAPVKSGGRFGRGMMAGMAVPVKVATAESGPLHYVMKAIGTVTAFNTVTVRSQVDGELIHIAFEEGAAVKQGDVLAEIDPRDYQVQLDQALGQQAQNAALLRNAQRDLQRYQQLFKQNSIARQQVDTQQAQVSQLQGAVKSDQAAVDSAKLQLSYTKIIAPISGRAGLRNVDAGNIINASNTEGLVVITQTQPIAVMFSLPQVQLPDVMQKLRAGKTLVVDAYDRDDVNRLASGTLVAVDNQIDVTTGTVKLKARFDNDDEQLFPNQFVNVRVRVDTTESLQVPVIAVQQGTIGAFVYRLDDEDKVHVQTVKTGRVDDGQIGIVSGLTQGQRVVVEGVDRLREGAKVEVVKPGANAPAASLPATGPDGAKSQPGTTSQVGAKAQPRSASQPGAPGQPGTTSQVGAKTQPGPSSQSGTESQSGAQGQPGTKNQADTKSRSGQ